MLVGNEVLMFMILLDIGRGNACDEKNMDSGVMQWVKLYHHWVAL